MIALREYLDRSGRSPYAAWFNALNAPAAAKVAGALARMALGNFSSVKGVGGGVHEYRIDFGPGYRIYFGKGGEELVILLGGGTKKTAAARYRKCPGPLAGLQTAKTSREVTGNGIDTRF